MTWKPAAGKTDTLDAALADDFAQRYRRAWNSHDAGQLLALLSDDVHWEDPATPPEGIRGHRAVASLLESYWRAFPDLRFDPLDGGEAPAYLSSNRRRLAVPWRGTGTMRGPLDPPGFAPTNGRVEMVGIDVCEFRGGLVCRLRSFSDTTPVARQIGAAPPPGSGGERIGVLLQRLAARRRRRRLR